VRKHSNARARRKFPTRFAHFSPTFEQEVGKPRVVGAQLARAQPV
jgi:hypothetical protein